MICHCFAAYFLSNTWHHSIFSSAWSKSTLWLHAYISKSHQALQVSFPLLVLAVCLTESHQAKAWIVMHVRMSTWDAQTYFLFRLGAGSRYQQSKLPKQPLELWAYELSPFCKVCFPQGCQNLLLLMVKTRCHVVNCSAGTRLQITQQACHCD